MVNLRGFQGDPHADPRAEVGLRTDFHFPSDQEGALFHPQDAQTPAVPDVGRMKIERAEVEADAVILDFGINRGLVAFDENKYAFRLGMSCNVDDGLLDDPEKGDLHLRAEV